MTASSAAPNTAPEVPYKTAGEVWDAKVSFVGKLETGETLTGTPTFTEQRTSDITVASQAVNTAIATISGASVAIGQAATAKFSGGVAGRQYVFSVSCGTSAGNTRIGRIEFYVIAD